MQAELEKQSQEEDLSMYEDFDVEDPNLKQEEEESGQEGSGDKQELQEEEQQEEQKQEEQKKEEVAPLTPDAIAEAVARGMKSGGEAPSKSEQKELTQEEIDEILHPAKVTVDDLRGLGLINEDDEDQVASAKAAVLQDVIQRAVRNAVSVSNVSILQQLQPLQQQIEPLAQQIQAQQMERMQQEFYGKYPALQDYGDVVKIAADQLMGENAITDSMSFDDAGKAIATRTSALIKKFGGKEIDFSAATPQSGQSGVPKPAGTASPGRSQAGRTPKGNKGPAEFDIYDED